MIKTPLSTVIGGAFWTPGATILGSASKTLDQLIKSLFTNNEQGFAYDPNDLTTMFQDAAGAVPVTGAGQPVGLIKDKSGRGNHARQTTSASRPILRQNAVTGANYLEFDGSDDFLVTNSINFTATDKVSLFTGVRKLSDASTVPILELGIGPTVVGYFGLLAPALSGITSYSFASNRGTLSQSAGGAFAPAPDTSVISALSLNRLTLRRNGVLADNSVTNTDTGNYGNYPLFIGRRANTTPLFNGHIYGLIGIGKLVSENETAAIEKALAKRTGVTLNV